MTHPAYVLRLDPSDGPLWISGRYADEWRSLFYFSRASQDEALRWPTPEAAAGVADHLGVTGTGWRVVVLAPSRAVPA
jgi:hypothetical protein